MERETQTVWITNKPNFELGETEKFWSERFQRYFENTLLQKFDPDNAVRCEDVYGEKGWIVGHQAEIFLGENLPVKRTHGYNLVLRDKDNAVVGVREEMIKWKTKP